MTPTEARTAIVEAISAVAPDADPTAIAGTDDMMEELELDSIDLVGIATQIHERTGVEIPERDYSHLETLDGFVDYLAAASRSVEP